MAALILGSSTGVNLLDEEGSITDAFETCLKHIFSKYCTPSPLGYDGKTSERHAALLSPPANAYLTPDALDRWAVDTNGTPFTQESKDELKEFLDVTDDDCLTFEGFVQLYQLQTENDEEETWRDLEKHGFDRNLNLIDTR